MPAGPLDADEVQRVHRDVIVRIRRVLEAYELNPSALGLPPRDGDTSTLDHSTDGNYEQPLLDFGDARDGSFFPGLKSASVQSAVPFGPRAGLPLTRLKDPDLARAFEAAGWPIQRVSPRLVANENGFSLHAATRVKAGERDRLEKLCRYSGKARTLSQAARGPQRWSDLLVAAQGLA